MPRRKLAPLIGAAILLVATPSVLALNPPASPTANPTPTGAQTDPGFILVVVVIPVVLLALIWMGYIFWLIFHEGENVGSGGPAPPGNRDQRPPNRSPDPPDQPGNVG